MIRILGSAAVVAALVAAIFGVVAAIVGARSRRPGLLRAAERAVFANFWLMTVANLAMVWALVTHDFSVSYVAQVGSRATPLFFTIISLWSSLEGSILFWGWVLAAYTAAAVWVHRGRLGSVVPASPTNKSSESKLSMNTATELVSPSIALVRMPSSAPRERTSSGTRPCGVALSMGSTVMVAPRMSLLCRP